MSWAKICDLCGAYIDISRCGGREFHIKRLDEEVDLCNDCYKKVEDVLKPKKEVKETPKFKEPPCPWNEDDYCEGSTCEKYEDCKLYKKRGGFVKDEM